MAALELFILDSSFSALSYTPVGIASDAFGVTITQPGALSKGVTTVHVYSQKVLFEYTDGAPVRELSFVNASDTMEGLN